MVSEQDLRRIIREELRALVDETRDEPQPRQNDIIDIGQACELLGLAKPTIYGLVSSRSIPHFKQGRKLRFSRRELEAWIEAGRRDTHESMKAYVGKLLHKRGNQVCPP